MELYVIARDFKWRSKQVPRTPLYPQIRPAVGLFTEANVKIKSIDMEEYIK